MNSPGSAVPEREIPSGFIQRSQKELQATRDLGDLKSINRGIVSEAALAKMCVQDPERFRRMVNDGLRLDAYPTLGKTILDLGGKAKDLDVTLRLFKQAGGRLEWDELRHGARVLRTKDFLVLMKHTPQRDTTATADMFATILADQPHHVPEVLRSSHVGSKKQRVEQALHSLRPELMKGLQPNAEPGRLVNPLLPRRDSEPLMGR